MQSSHESPQAENAVSTSAGISDELGFTLSVRLHSKKKKKGEPKQSIEFAVEKYGDQLKILL